MCLWNDEANQHLDRMDEISNVWAAFSDLMAPDFDIQEKQRDRIAMALDFLHREYNAARDRLSASLATSHHSPAREAGMHHRTDGTAVTTPGTIRCELPDGGI